MKRDEISNEQIKEALDKSHGIALIAARRLGIHRNTLAYWIEEDEDLKKHYKAGKESLIDLAESKFVQNIKAGKEKSILFALSTLGKERGYVERHEYAEHIEQELFPDADHNAAAFDETEEYDENE